MADSNSTEAMMAELAALRQAVTSLQGDAATFAVAADQFWLLYGSTLVFFMQCGFALLEAGAVRSKTTQNILLKVREQTIMRDIIRTRTSPLFCVHSRTACSSRPRSEHPGVKLP